jgi:hypothetical protein
MHTEALVSINPEGPRKTVFEVHKKSLRIQPIDKMGSKASQKQSELGLGVKSQSGPRSRKPKKASELYISKLGFVANRAGLIRLAE